MRSEPIQIGVSVKKDKLIDIDKLLKKHFGQEWVQNPALLFYKNVMSAAGEILEEPNEPFCEENPEVQDLRV